MKIEKHFRNLRHNLALTLVIVFLTITSCSSDETDNPVDETEQMGEEGTLDFNLLVDSWEAQNFIFESPNNTTPDTDVKAIGGSVDLNVMEDGTFVFDFTFTDFPAFMNSGEFRIEDNTLQARFETDMDFRDLEAELNQQLLKIKGEGRFDLSGEGSNVTSGFVASFVRK
ncbi:hypothetical protein [Croceivirga thetidis]|uniref:DUF5004 domain-containing protein n=1 Tax=Croceivirga thetidis TaxID=2721623 RepID=A0ABX1GUP6_9FLAO|nr:hypothetical protein [Croceivirga thetidis]NKI32640.1 hypothetical protein [Croceivirga thetidis]